MEVGSPETSVCAEVGPTTSRTESGLGRMMQELEEKSGSECMSCRHALGAHD
eukprot:CAMPEP_0119334340 /NCGR_PEP_ID=MMETSP1333-20130426/87078_1 /TAXON_ID=418940 /ORGANISM="Scyphosphaera apsteinii, Strain RCC1455" /LENGTH=51 /DNA_ID=CAMNT_0007344609 /DNA_START=602 /DNA_END=757 /DNA_ORIENTATION=+